MLSQFIANGLILLFFHTVLSNNVNKKSTDRKGTVAVKGTVSFSSKVTG